MSDTVGAHQRPAQRAGRPQGRAPRPVPQSGDQGRRTSPGWSSRSRTWTAPRRFAHAFGFATVAAHRRRTAAARHRRGRAVRDPAPGAAVAVRRHRVHRRTTRSTCCASPTPRAATARPLPETIGGIAVDLVDPSGIPVRVVAGTHDLARAARPGAARLQRRPRLAAHQRDPAPAAGARQGAAARPRRAADHQVHRGARTGTSTTSG